MISIIISTKNEALRIGHSVASLRQLGSPEQLEILVVDNYSSDNTARLAQDNGAKIVLAGPERSRQRNIGASLSTGNILVFLDADQVLSPEFIPNLLFHISQYSNGNAIAWYIPEVLVGTSSIFHRSLAIEKALNTHSPIDTVRVIPKDLFTNIGGYDESLTGSEDWDLDTRVRTMTTTQWLDAPMYHDIRSLTLTSYLYKKRYYSQAVLQYALKWGDKHPDVIVRTTMIGRVILLLGSRISILLFLSDPLSFLYLFIVKFFVFMQYKITSVHIHAPAVR